jgi:ParB family transcriptional regulator, chromosome partitioning protein
MSTEPIVAAEQVVPVPLSEIMLSPTNPRQSFNAQRLEELTADVRRRGVQEPILIRPVTGAERKFQVVYGERRYRASEKAGKETVPAIVRPLTDEQVLELQIIENLQREDLHPLDEAEAFQRLYEMDLQEQHNHDKSIALVAARVGKEPDDIEKSLKLQSLTEAAKTAFRKNLIVLGHAFELCRLREDEQKQALAFLTQSTREVNQPSGGRKNVKVMPGVPDLKLWIQQNLFLDLEKAPFDTQDATLNKEMGACSTCQFRTGNQPVLFSDVRKGDICTVPSCWKEKRNTTVINIANAAAQELGVHSVLKIGIGYRSWNESKVPVDAYIEYGTEFRIVAEGSECDHTKPGVITWIGSPSDAGRRTLQDRVFVCTKSSSCAKHNKVGSRGPTPRKSYEQMADTRIHNLRESIPQRVRAALIQAVTEKAKAKSRNLSSAERIEFDLVARQMHQDLFFDRHRDLCKLMNVEPGLDRYKNKDWRATSRKMFDKNPVALMTAMVLMHRYHVGTCGPEGDPLKLLVQVYKVDATAIEKRVKAEIGERIASIQTSLKKHKTKASKKTAHKAGDSEAGSANKKAPASAKKGSSQTSKSAKKKGKGNTKKKSKA